ncbi:MAG: DUF305 domain-containing protein [Acidimicrobiia bacterium]
MDDDHGVQTATRPAEPPTGASGRSAGDEPGRPGRPRRPTWVQALVLSAAVAFVGFAVGLVVARDRPPGPSSVDVGYTQDMIHHHDQAVQMAMLALDDVESPVVRSFVREVLVFQSYELGLMDQQLADWGTSRQQRSDQAMEWMGMPVPLEDMPGLLSEQEMDAIAAAEGAELDALFLDLMAEHHRGGLHMAEYAAREADDEDVRALATRIVRNQAGEINEYRSVAEDEGLDVEIERAVVPPDLAP